MNAYIYSNSYAFHAINLPDMSNYLLFFISMLQTKKRREKNGMSIIAHMMSTITLS